MAWRQVGCWRICRVMRGRSGTYREWRAERGCHRPCLLSRRLSNANRYLASAGRASNGLPLLSTDWDISPTCVVKCGRPQVRAPQPRVMRSLRMRWPWQAERVLHLPPHNTIIQLIKSYPPYDMWTLT